MKPIYIGSDGFLTIFFITLQTSQYFHDVFIMASVISIPMIHFFFVRCFFFSWITNTEISTVFDKNTSNCRKAIFPDVFIFRFC